MNRFAIAAFDGFVGFEGRSVRVHAGEKWNLDDPVSARFVAANPHRFTVPEPEVEPVRPSVSRLSAKPRSRARASKSPLGASDD